MRSPITVENVSKRFRISQPPARPTTRLASALAALRMPFQYMAEMSRPPTEAETLWALRNVSFDVKQGEVVGLIGRNGAGKSTLLKILSRITDPTEGRAVLVGRVGSLLEVGTGFNPELTGRENIYLSGTILGMRRAEIERKFDEIVAFAGVEKFIDTPVKRYSSGMNVRLGFAVAAHLEPEILIVDEVLSVGDAAFQRKSLGKMENIAHEGRTILFVSHSMPAIQAFCQRVIMMENGQISQMGTPDEVIGQYLGQEAAQDALVDLTQHGNRTTPPDEAAFTRLRLVNNQGASSRSFIMGEPVKFEMALDLGRRVLQDPLISIEIERQGQKVCSLATHYMVKEPIRLDGKVLVSCEWNPGWLAPGSYNLAQLTLKTYSGGSRLDMIREVTTFEIVGRDVYGTGKVAIDGTLLVPDGRWEILNDSEAAPTAPNKTGRQREGV